MCQTGGFTENNSDDDDDDDDENISPLADEDVHLHAAAGGRLVLVPVYPGSPRQSGGVLAHMQVDLLRLA